MDPLNRSIDLIRPSPLFGARVSPRPWGAVFDIARLISTVGEQGACFSYALAVRLLDDVVTEDASRQKVPVEFGVLLGLLHVRFDQLETLDVEQSLHRLADVLAESFELDDE